jgi:hypothetical protein
MGYAGSGFRNWVLIAIGLVAATIAVMPAPAVAQEDHSGLTRASFRRNCLLCHHSAAPEGISPEIMAGLTPVPGLKPRDAMPGVVCQRRCEACKIPDPPATGK